MPPLASSDQLGFTSSLLTTLRESRAQLDAFIDDQMEQADAAAAAHEARVSQEQTLVDAQVSNLLAVELERGLNLREGNKDNTIGLAKRREELARQQDGLKQEIDELQAKVSEQKKELKGMTTGERVELVISVMNTHISYDPQACSWKKLGTAIVQMKRVT